MRKLASIQRVLDIQPIENADAIEVATVNGWKVVVKKDEFQVNNLVVYCEVDSWVPTALAPFLSKGKEPKEYKGVKGERLRTVKLRKQISQGLLLPISVLPVTLEIEEDLDVSEVLGVFKWEIEFPASLRGLAKGNYPSFLFPKTDQERIQNCWSKINKDLAWTVEEKLEGYSATFAVFNNEEYVCSRKISLKIADENKNNAFVAAYFASNLADVLKRYNKNIAIQGELIGPDIRGNIYKLTANDFRVFDIFLIDQQRYAFPQERVDIIGDLIKLGAKLNLVPVIKKSFSLKDFTLDTLLEFADGKSELANTAREGLVFKCVDQNITFKVVSNSYLLKSKN